LAVGKLTTSAFIARKQDCEHVVRDTLIRVHIQQPNCGLRNENIMIW
jgi:hypothetical protein